jgi:integrase
MAKTAKTAKLDTPTARSKVEPGETKEEPLDEAGHYLTYWRGFKGVGSWGFLWIKMPDKSEKVRKTFGKANDLSPEDGEKILNYKQAKAKAREHCAHLERQSLEDVPLQRGSFTVADALDAYFIDAERRGVRGVDRDKLRVRAWILSPVLRNGKEQSPLGEIEVSKLTRAKIEQWQDNVAKSPKRLRTRIGQPQAYAPPPTTDEEKRKRKDSANRVLTSLKAALTFAVDRRLVQVIDPCWQKVKPYEGTTSARLRYLQSDEATRFVNVCPPDFRDLVRGALLTGARYQELARAKCKDYNPNGKVPTLFIAFPKNNKPRYVILNCEGVAFFDELTAKRQSPDDLLFLHHGVKEQTRNDKGKFDSTNQEYELRAWGKGHQARYMEAAYRAAGLEKITFHELRHTYATMLLNQGCPPIFVADQIGDNLNMVLKHYGHICDLAKAAAVRAAMPRLGIVEPARVKKLKIGGA